MPRGGAATPKWVVGSRGTLSPGQSSLYLVLPSSSKNPKQAPLRPTLTPSLAINTALGLWGQTLSWCKAFHNGTIYTHQGPPAFALHPWGQG